MKNEIDDILNSMFKGGKLNLSKSEPVPELKLPENPAKTDKVLEEFQQVNQELSRSLQDSIEQLTREAQADMNALDARLREDGVRKEDAPAGNAGEGKQMAEAFQKAEQETGEVVLGQESFLRQLTIAYKRPFVAGFHKEVPMARVAVLGPRGSGRHSAVITLTDSLYRQGVLKSPKVVFLDLARYADASSEKVFVQDVYAGLKGGASALVFEQYEKCHTAVLSMVSALFQTGCMPLPGRYTEQKGMLVDIGTALVPNTVSTLSAAGKYILLLTESGEGRLADAFGAGFLSALDDICKSESFTDENLKKIAEKALRALSAKCEKQIGFTVNYGAAEVEVLAGKVSRDKGAESIDQYCAGLYRAISEEKLHRGFDKLTGTITAEEGELVVHSTAGEEALLIRVQKTDAASQSALEEVKAELSEIVGLRTVKEYILSLEDNFKIQQIRKEKGMKADSPSMHMIFTGNPGTGKTTVARIVSRYLKAIGVLTGGQLVEVTRADLVGKYVGHTAPLTQKAIEAALGGVLFVDEAYALFRGRDDSFGLECIDTLVKGMEDHRSDLIVILAGYSREMEEFLTANSGLKSRFPNIIEFPDYTAQELLDITKSIVRGKGYQLDSGCDVPLRSYYERAQKEGDARTNGNGRMARNKVEEAVIACSRRTVREPEETRNLELLLPVDFGFAAPEAPAATKE